MAAPEEVVAAPLTIYLAVVGTAFPAIDDLVADFDAAWEVLGTEGDANYDDSGVVQGMSETTNDFTPAGRTMPTKRFRTAESSGFKLNLVDMGPTAWAKVMNDASITTVAASTGVAGYDKFSLVRGDQVASFAVCARGLSSVDNTLNLQVNISKAFVSVTGDVTWNKGVPAMLPVTIEAIHHADADLIDVLIQTAAAS